MQRADLTTRAVAGFVDFLLIVGLVRLPDILGFLAAAGYILIRDGLFDRRSIGKKLIGLRVAASEGSGTVTYRESIIRNVTFAAAYLLFLIPYAGWVLGPIAVGVECLAAIGDERGMRIGDLLARTVIIQDAPLAEQAREAPVHQPEPSAPVETSGPQGSQPHE
ncbi:MAG: RDD family protein [Betaproteobacteria bacterium]